MNNLSLIKETENIDGTEKSTQQAESQVYNSENKFKLNKSKKSKRQHSQSFCVSTNSTIETDDVNIRSKDDTHKHLNVDRLPFGKNSRKSRSVKDSKRGIGGKGKWSMRFMDIGDLEIDRKDPCYDSENDSVNFEENTLVLDEEKFDELVTNCVKEYFENSEPGDVLANLEGVNLIPVLSCRIPYLCIVQALQRKPAQCELTSRLLCELLSNIINQEEMITGFDLVIKELKELTIDCPEAPCIVGKFIARAIADHLLPQKYVHNHKKSMLCVRPVGDVPVTLTSNANHNIATSNNCFSEEQLRAFAKAELLFNIDHAYVRLDTVWGSPGGERPTKMLTSKIKLLLCEYLDSGDVKEAERCLRELEAPHFHHEVVFQGILTVIERSTEFVCTEIVKLLDSLCRSVIITIDQLEQGVTRIYEQMPDIVLDVPAAYLILERFISLAQKMGSFFSDKLAQKMPKCTRTRFVSEGHGFIR